MAEVSGLVGGVGGYPRQRVFDEKRSCSWPTVSIGSPERPSYLNQRLELFDGLKLALSGKVRPASAPAIDEECKRFR